MINKVVLIVIDSLGIGDLPDAWKYGDVGSNTLGNLAKAVNGVRLPNLQAMGLGNLGRFKGIIPTKHPMGAYGKMAEKSPGKDTTTGHWELAGIILNKPFPTYPNAFPADLIKSFEEKTGLKVLGNKVASGTEIINELGQEHVNTGYPIVYTSADSVFQIAAHEDIISVSRLYELCQTAREMLTGDHAVGRVIARPFIGGEGSFTRTFRRHDFSLVPPEPNLLTKMANQDLTVAAVGKIKDIFAGFGITKSAATKDNMEGIDRTLEFIKEPFKGLIFTNLVEFDMLYGHRNDYVGYAKALEDLDNRIPEISETLGANDILIITADHGCDPTTVSTDHSREYVPLLITGNLVSSGTNLGIRDTFADVAATISEIFGLDFLPGDSFASKILKMGEY